MLEKWKYNYIELSHPDNFMAAKWKKITREDLKSSYKFFYENESIK